MLKAIEILNEFKRDEASGHLLLLEFIDTFRRENDEIRTTMIEQSLLTQGKYEGLIAAVISALCRELHTPVPEWVGETSSPEPYFPMAAKSYALRVRLMLESPAAFRVRRVFVPENFLHRA
jgi:hypothetical protein